jgi:hypothetical protein
MSVVIIGGHDRMACTYSDICKEYKCRAKVFTQPAGNLEGMIGEPDLIVLFTNPVSHKMAKVAKNQAARKEITLIQSHSGSGSALREILKRVFLNKEGGLIRV